MFVDRDSSKPIYLQVADNFRNNIYSEKWGTGEKIPSENQIMSELKISRGTVKKAVGILVEEGLLEQIQGKGTYVKGNDISYPLSGGLLSFAESLENQNLGYETSVVTSELRVSNNDIATKLKLKEGDDYFYLERIRSVEGEKMMLIESRLNHYIAPGIEKVDFNAEKLFHAIESKSGNQIKHSVNRYAARIIDGKRAKILEVPENSPVLHLEQLVYLENGEPIEFANVWLKANKYHIGTILQREEI